MTQLTSTNRRFCGMQLGYPGAGKTGSWACLANAGYKLRIIDLDHNLDPLLEFVDEENYKNVEVVSLYDRLKLGARRLETVKPPTVFAKTLKLLSHWKYTDPETEEEIDFGKPMEWGTDTVLILDSGTALGHAAKRRETFIAPDWTPTDSIYGGAMDDQESVMQILGSNQYKCHVIVTFHLKMIGPKLRKDKKETDAEKDAKEAAAEIIETRLYPSSLGWLLPPIIGSNFPTTILNEAKTVGNKTKRIIRTTPCSNIDIKLALQGLPAELPIEDGMLQIFNKLKGE